MGREQRLRRSLLTLSAEVTRLAERPKREAYGPCSEASMHPLCFVDPLVGFLDVLSRSYLGCEDQLGSSDEGMKGRSSQSRRHANSAPSFMFRKFLVTFNTR